MQGIIRPFTAGALASILAAAAGMAIPARSELRAVRTGYRMTPAPLQILLPIMGASRPSHTPILTNQTTNFSIALPASWATTIPAPANGNVLLVNLTSGGSTDPTISSISATNTSGWTRLVSNSGGSLNNLVNVEMWYGNVGAAAGTTVTITMSGAGSGAGVNISEWACLAASGLPDGTGSSAVVNSANPTTAPYSTTVAGDLVIATVGTSPQGILTASPGGYTALTAALSGGTVTNTSNRPYYQVGSGTGAQSASWTYSAAINAVALLQGLKHC